MREVYILLAGVSPSKCGVAVQYFEELSDVAVELRTKGQEEKETERKKGFCAVVFIPGANTTQGNLIRLSLSVLPCLTKHMTLSAAHWLNQQPLSAKRFYLLKCANYI